MNIILTSVEPALADAWERHCGALDCVTVSRGSILDPNCDAVVSPANSFGFMDGGIDLLYSHHFGWRVQERLQQFIRTRHHGELLVGMAEIIETDNERIPYVIAAPTMRVPMILANDSVSPYLAARAVLLLIKHGTFHSGVMAGEPIANVVQTVAFPGLGTGVGRIGPNTCAWQVKRAIEEVIYGQTEYPKSFADAMLKHQQLYTDRIRNLQLEK